ncbi:hypothetical protein FH972_011443 [Carpinus fangiana]|uniref:RING-type E3 ubiquitin transferase n=1 Tax=Carpinus fangiana TaxID=176857 RepID=A0A660KRD2_9ROSI|nr:hypothetical protein FH972_011443 [Carpinus fangiana]
MNSWTVPFIATVCTMIPQFSYYRILKSFCYAFRGVSYRNRVGRHLLNEANPDDPSLQFHSRGLESSILYSLPMSQFKKNNEGEHGQSNPEDCAVCLGEFEEGQWLKRLPNCRHAFHVPCIDTCAGTSKQGRLYPRKDNTSPDVTFLNPTKLTTAMNQLMPVDNLVHLIALMSSIFLASTIGFSLTQIACTADRRRGQHITPGPTLETPKNIQHFNMNHLIPVDMLDQLNIEDSIEVSSEKELKKKEATKEKLPQQTFSPTEQQRQSLSKLRRPNARDSS